MKEKVKLPALSGVIFTLLFLIVGMAVSVVWLNIPIHITLVATAIVASIVAMRSGYSWTEIEEAIKYGCNIAMVPMLILMAIGALIGSWIISGTVPTLIYYGLKIIHPSIFLVTVCLVCCIASVATGSSWTTGGTFGVAFMGIGMGLGIPMPLVAGAVVSGAVFGDKMSPLSDSTILTSAVAEEDLFTHIKNMLYSTVPSLVIALVVFAIMGIKYGGGEIDTSQINVIVSKLNENFVINPILLIPPILVIIMAIKKVPSIPSLLIAALLACILAVAIQGKNITEITNVLNYGYKSETGIEMVDKLLTRGGIQSMMWTVSLGFIGLSLGGILEKTRILEVLITKLERVTSKSSSLALTTIVSCLIMNFVTASQYMAVIIPGRMLVPKYKELKLLPRNLSRMLDDAAVVTSPLVPWGLCGVFFAGVLGVPTVQYAPFAIMCIVTPIISAIYGITGFAIFKEGDIKGARTYSEKIEMNA